MVNREGILKKELKNHPELLKILLFLIMQLLFLCPGIVAHSIADCDPEKITEKDKAKYIIHPWYPITPLNEDGLREKINDVSVTETYDETINMFSREKEPAYENTHEKSSAGSLESEIILGLTDFITDRAKAEAVQLVITNMEKELCTEDYHDYFMNTCKMQSQSKETMPYLSGLVIAFRKDLEMLPATLLCKNFDTDKGYFLKNLIKEIIDGIPIENLVAGLAQNDIVRDKCLHNTKDGETCDLFLAGLTAQAYLNFKGNIYIIKDIQANFTNITNYKSQNIGEEELMQYFLELANIFKDIDVQVKIIKKARREGRVQGTVIPASVIRISKDLLYIIYSNKLFRLPDDDAVARNYIEPSINAVCAVEAGQYSEALLEFNKIMTLYRDDKFNEQYRSPSYIYYYSSTEEIIEDIAISYDLKKNQIPIDSGMNLSYADKPVQKYLPIISSLAMAKDKDEVRNVLNETAASVGSWRLKQRKDHTISFGAMIGAQLSYEWLNQKEKIGSGGFFAPVGFDLTAKKCYLRPCGLFISIIDIGTLVSARYNNDNVSNIKGDTTFPQVVSPGAYLHFSPFKETPILLGAGYSYVPMLRSVNVNGTWENQGGHRGLIFLSIDLPIYFLY